MAIKMGGLICDRCRIVVVTPDDPAYHAYMAFNKLYGNTIRIYCPDCSVIVMRAENYMALKDVGDVHDIPESKGEGCGEDE